MVDTAVSDLRGVSNTQSGDGAGAGTNSAAEVPDSLGTVSWFDVAGP